MESVILGGRYKIIEQIDQGGWGNLYLVRDDYEEREAILKTAVEEEEVKALENEYRILSQLRHPNIVRAFDFYRGGILSGYRVFFTMEHIKGPKMTEAIEARRPDYFLFSRLMVQICQALSYMHRLGIIHGDINPGNILLQNSGAGEARRSYSVKLVDFGHAGWFKLLSQKKGASTLRGNLGYTAPEYFSNKPVDQRADLYSLGVVAYELVTGKNPFLMDTPLKTGMAHLEKEVSPPREINEEVPQRLSGVIQKLLAKDPALRYRHATEVLGDLVTPMKAKRILTPTTFRFYSSFIGREEEFSALQRYLSEVKNNKPQSCLIKGEFGVGKTRLLNEFEREVQIGGARIFKSVCHHDEDKAYQTIVELLNQMVKYLGAEASGILEKYKVQLSRLAPEFYESEEASLRNQPLEIKSEKDKILLFESLSHFIWEMTKRIVDPQNGVDPLVLAVEDIHFSDQSSLDYLKYFLNTLNRYEDYTDKEDRCHLMLLATMDDDYFETRSGMGSPGRESVHSEDLYSNVVNLEPFDKKSTQEMLSSMLGAANFEEVITDEAYKATSGNPLFVEEILYSMIEKGVIELRGESWIFQSGKSKQHKIPQSLQQSMEGRLEGLFKTDWELLRHASVLRGDFTVEDIVGLANIDSYLVLESLSKLMNRRLITTVSANGDLRYRFSYLPMKEYIYSAIDKKTRELYHKRVAKYYEKKTQEDQEKKAGDLAYHHYHSNNYQKGALYALRAGHQSASIYNIQQALTYYQWSLEMMRKKGALKHKFEALKSMGQLLGRTGRYSESEDAYNKALQIVKNRKFSAEKISSLYMNLARLQKRKGNAEKAREIMEKGLEVLPDWSKSRTGVSLKMDLAWQHIEKREIDQALEICEETLSKVKSQKQMDLQKSKIYNAMGSAYLSLGKLDDARDTYRQALSLLDANKNIDVRAVNYLNLGLVFFKKSQYHQALEHFNYSLEIFHKTGNFFQLAKIYQFLANTHRELGEVAKAEEFFNLAIMIGQKMNDHRLIISSNTNLGLLFEDIGQWKKAESCFRKALSLAEKYNQHIEIARNLLNLGFLKQRTGRWDDALKFFNESLEIWIRSKDQGGMADCFSHIGNIYKEKGEYPLAEKFLNKSINLYSEMEAGKNLAKNTRILAEVKLAQDDVDQAVDLCDKALELAEQVGHKMESSEIHHLLGKIRLKQKQFNKARSDLDKALKFFQELDSVAGLSRVYLTFANLFIELKDYEKALRFSKNAVDNFQRLEAQSELAKAQGLVKKIESEMQTKTQTDVYVLLDTFSQIASILNSLTEPEDLLERILEQAIRFVGAERGMIFLLDDSSGELYPQVTKNLDPKTMEDAKDYSRNIVRSTLEKNEPLFSNNALSDERFFRFRSVQMYNILSLLCVPMFIENKIIGTIYVDSRKSQDLFSERDRDFLSAFANLAAVAIDRSNYYKQQQEEFLLFKKNVEQKYSYQNLIIGNSKKMLDLFKQLPNISQSDSTVLIEGEMGTGKDLFARAIHLNSARRDKPFHPVNCAAIPESLLESQIFGHVKGSFTGAYRDQKGAFEIADGGTLFLDEIAELNFIVQSKLLRALNDGEIQKLGAGKKRKVDVRIITATNKDLIKEVKNGNFREDLFYRINVLPLRLPPLRERKDDIPILAAEFLARKMKRMNKMFKGFTREAITCLKKYNWPGNVRDLENVVEFAVVYGKPPLIKRKDLPPRIKNVSVEEVDETEEHELFSLAEMEKKHIQRTLKKLRWRKIDAARVLGISRPTLDRKMEEYRIPWPKKQH